MTIKPEKAGSVGGDASAHRRLLSASGMEHGAHLPLADGRLVLFRPAVETDAAGIAEMFARSDPDDLRRLGFDSCRPGAGVLAAQLHGRPDRDLTWIGLLDDGAVAGILHLAREEPGASFSIMVRSDLQRLGLGRAMLAHTEQLCRLLGWTPLRAETLIENGAMIDLARRLGATVRGPDAGGVMQLMFTGPA